MYHATCAQACGETRCLHSGAAGAILAAAFGTSWGEMYYSHVFALSMSSSCPMGSNPCFVVRVFPGGLCAHARRFVSTGLKYPPTHPDHSRGVTLGSQVVQQHQSQPLPGPAQIPETRCANCAGSYLRCRCRPFEFTLPHVRRPCSAHAVSRRLRCRDTRQTNSNSPAPGA
jgi:hypothetical protein